MSESGNGDDNNNNIRFENSSSYGRISSNQDSLYFRENTLTSNSGNGAIINSFNSNESNKVSEDLIKDSNKIKKINLEPESIIINRNDNKILIFIRVLGYNIAYHETNINTKIGEIIEKYINKNNLDEKLKEQFFIGEHRIYDLDKTLKDLEVSNLTIISTK